MIIRQPRGPTCQVKPMPAHITPAAFAFDIRAFERPTWEDVHQCVVELADLMEFLEIAGWLRGELQAPT